MLFSPAVHQRRACSSHLFGAKAVKVCDLAQEQFWERDTALVKREEPTELRKALSAFRNWRHEILAFFDWSFHPLEQWVRRGQEQPHESADAARLWLSQPPPPVLAHFIASHLTFFDHFHPKGW